LEKVQAKRLKNMGKSVKKIKKETGKFKIKKYWGLTKRSNSCKLSIITSGESLLCRKNSVDIAVTFYSG